MDLRDYLRALRRSWLLVVLCTVLAAGAAVAVIATTTPVYQATTQLFVSARDSSDISAAYQGGQFTQERVKSYADIVASPVVTKPVIAQLGLHLTSDELAAKISADAPLDTVLINVSVQDTSPAQAARIANAVGQTFTTVVNDLEKPADGGTSPVKVSVVKPADVPAAPVSPKKTLDLALGLLVGLALGVGAAVLRDTLDNRVGTKHDAARLTASAVLGAIGEDPQAKTSPLIVTDGEFSPRTEAFRQLRTNIKFLSVDRSLHSLVVTGSVDAEGKTSTAVNLAIAFAQAGHRAVLVDGDLRRPNVAAMLGIPGGVGLTSVLVGDVALADAVQTWKRDLPLQVLASGPIPPNPAELLSSQRLLDVLTQLGASADIVIVDSPPLLAVTDAAVLSRVTDGAVLVTRVESTKADQLHEAASALRAAGGTLLGVVLNRVPKRGKSSSYYRYSYYQAAGATAGGAPVPGAVLPPQDRRRELQAEGAVPPAPVAEPLRRP